MCGVVALFAYAANAPPVSRDELLRIRDAMASRGPDGSGEWVGADNRVALGHRRLAIIDLSPGGAQPMASADGALRITFNGEIYNYRELRAELEQKGRRFRSSSDTEVILQLYEEEGAAMLPRLRGMFAFALWDERRRGLLLARDPMGIKPLYYADDGTLRVASQVKALIAGGAVPTRLGPAGCVSFFLFGYVSDPFTIRDAVRALPAGHSLWIDAAGPQAPRPFFSIRDVFAAAEEEAAALTPERRQDLLRASLAESVAAHLVADVPVGIFLSAGYDSTSVTALAAEQSARLQTLTLGFAEYRGADEDEVPVAEEVAHAFGADHRTMWVRRDDFVAEQERLFAVMDQPTIDGANTYLVSRVAARAHLKVALSGLGGDELFGGYPSFHQIPRLARWLAPLRPVPVVGRTVRILSSRLISTRLSPKFAGLIEYGTALEDAYLLRRALYMPWELPKLLDPEVVRTGWAALKPLISLRESVAGLRRDHVRVAVLEMSWYMRNQLLRDTDWAGMAHSVEVRTPLVDAVLLRQLAPLLYGAQAPSKLDMARATPVRRLEPVLARRKTGFTVPVREWLLGESGAGGEHGFRAWAQHVFRQYLSPL
jgi:asparagine synthase (glutamine-hydrolysing)